MYLQSDFTSTLRTERYFLLYRNELLGRTAYTRKVLWTGRGVVRGFQSRGFAAGLSWLPDRRGRGSHTAGCTSAYVISP